jgi:hypothetical protein
MALPEGREPVLTHDGGMFVQSAAGGRRATAPTWPVGPKEGSRRPRRKGFPAMATWVSGRALRPVAVSVASPHGFQIDDQPATGALRAPLNT